MDQPECDRLDNEAGQSSTALPVLRTPTSSIQTQESRSNHVVTTRAMPKSIRTRSVTGCTTCKIRRVKCDEGKPACKRCTSTGRKCDGYAAPRQPPLPNPPVALLMVVRDSPYPDRDVKARDMVQYYYLVSAPSLANFGSQNFWTGLVMSIGQADESINHLIMAVSCLDHATRMGRVGEEDQEFIYNYGKALKVLSCHTDAVVILVACLLLVVCDDFQNNTYSSIRHITAGRKILASSFNQSELRHRLPIDLLNDILESLVVHCRELADQDTSISRLQYHMSHRSESDLLPQTPDNGTQQDDHGRQQQILNDLAFLERDLQILAPRCFTLPDPLSFGGCSSTTANFSAPSPPLTRFHTLPHITPLLNSWLERLNRYTSGIHSLTVNNPPAPKNRCVMVVIHRLRIFHQCLNMLSRCHPFGREVLFDSHAGEFDGMTKKLAILVNMGERRVLAPLFFLATRCRDAACRWTTVALLRSLTSPPVRDTCRPPNLTSNPAGKSGDISADAIGTSRSAESIYGSTVENSTDVHPHHRPFSSADTVDNDAESSTDLVDVETQAAVAAAAAASFLAEVAERLVRTEEETTRLLTRTEPIASSDVPEQCRLRVVRLEEGDSDGSGACIVFSRFPYLPPGPDANETRDSDRLVYRPLANTNTNTGTGTETSTRPDQHVGRARVFGLSVQRKNEILDRVLNFRAFC